MKNIDRKSYVRNNINVMNAISRFAGRCLQLHIQLYDV